ncbi:MAG: hypothetical protein Kow0022_16030 [Phycisphaerales bacterium]
MVLVDLSRDVVTAAGVTASARGLTVHRVAMAARPEHVAPDSPEQVGQWVRAALQDAGITTNRAVFAAPRGEVVLKMLELPTAGIENEAELCEAIRLQMSRQLTMPVEQSVIDWVMLESSDEQMLSVLVGVIHRERIEWYRQVAQHAKLRITGLRLRSSGIARLASEVEGPVLAIASGIDTTDFVVADGGRVLFARSVELKHAMPEMSLPLLQDDGSDADADLPQRIAVEAKRTWMSYRVSQQAEEVRGIVVLGKGEAAQEICDRCGAMLELSARCLDVPASVRIKPSVDESALGSFLPLLGLGVPAATGAGSLDFLHPRKPPDRGARRRQIALVCVLMLIVLGGVGYLLRQDRLDALEAEKAARQAQLDKLSGAYRAYLIERARAEHIRRWDAIDVDWVGYLAWLTERLPDPRVSLADRVTMALASQVKYEGRTFPGGVWSSESRVAVDLSGKVSDRSIALTLREKLLEAGLFTVVNRGPDVADRYDFELTTPLLSPRDAKGADGASEKPKENAQPDAQGEARP